MALHPQRLNLISLCTGGGGLDLGVELAMPDARTVCCVEREAFAASQLVCAIQKGLLAEAAIWSDVGTFDGRPWRGIVDGVIGGIPCQPHSLAGKRRGSDDERDLWSDARRIIVQSGAWFVLIENVPGMLSAKPGLDSGALRVRRDLQRLGFRVEAGLFTAAEVGASHKRERLFILAVADRCRFRGAPRFSASPGRNGLGSKSTIAHNNRDALEYAARERCGEGWTEPEIHLGRDAGAGDAVADASIARSRGLPVQQGRQDEADRDIDRPGLFPPGPSDLSGWASVLTSSPELEPAFRRVADGLASRLDVARVDRLRMLGNGVVSLEAAYAVRTLWARLGMQFMTATAMATGHSETFYFDRDRSPGVTITLPARPIDGDRNQYLREGIAAMIRRARRYMRAKDGEGTHWSEGYAGRIIEWALSLKEEGLVQATTADAEAPIDHPGREVAASADERVIEDSIDGHSGGLNQTTPVDPIIRSLCESHRARKTFPSGHTFAMTNPVINGHMVTLGTCTCGETFSYAYGSAGHERMDAAIEAHWQKFDGVAEKIDGRGFPIGEAVPPTKKSRKRKQPDAPGQPASIASAPVLVGTIGADAPLSELAEAGPHTAPRSEPAPHAPPSGAGSPLLEAAPIGAGLLAMIDDDDLTIEWPSYQAFLEDKIVTAPLRGIEVARESLHPWLKPHCKDLVVWALRLGCSAIFANFGLHKTAMQLEWCRQLHRHCAGDARGGATLNVVPLGVRHGFIKEALQLGMDVRFIRTSEEFHALWNEDGTSLTCKHFLTNYESIREGKLDPNLFSAVALDEASVLRSYGSKTYQEFLPLFSKVEFKLVATATPSPNRYKELIHYAGFLGVMDTGLALTRWFQRNSEKAGDLTLYPHKEDEFWMWVHSWAAFLQRPSELGYSDDGYELPPLKLTWHEVPADHSKAEPERDGQGVMFRDVANSLQEAAKARRDSLASRIAKMMDIIAQDPQSHRVIWHDLEAEREAIEAALPGVVTIMGSMDIDAREERLRAFEEGETRHFATKPILSGSGSNFQYHCHKAIYVALPGYGYKFNDFLQSLYRLQRFGQTHLVEVDIIYAEDERSGRAALEEKWGRDAEMRSRMSEIILKHGLNTLPLRDALLRSIGVKRVEIRGENFIAINNDAVAECRTWPENSVDLMVSSIPFGTQYEYSASYHDFGHSDDSGHFWSQMDFLSTELLRMLKPGRLACIHVKDRVLFGAVTGQGVPTVSPFHAEAIMHYRAHGFQYLGMITVVTDVVRENNQTYRLGWSENAKDGTKMGVGMPEYILLLRKPQSNRTKSYADVPVVKSKEDYTRARWQIDAHAFWRSSGNRHLTPEEFAQCSSADLARLFSKTTVDRVYDFEAHVSIGEAVEITGTLPATFMAIAPGSHHPDVWHDINRMRTLNMMQARKGQEMHLCPLQFDIVDRLIERYSNEGDLVFDPFGGLMTVPYRALLKGRKGAATELSAAYFLDGVHYLHAAEEKLATPQLFDLAQFDAVNTPPLTDLAEADT